ncbi:tyrosine-type recombinase/integrase [Burkholderia sp. BCC1970]|uniref:tyrosine-type recombinase/integrase n=1 Tax=Burkholderia sp. BCC1970 TaxID=2817437 RepID=UPI002ABE73F1|nr:tyrosine-type recombinase/integrase [Burkholderia sp. BCC1970]
MSEGGTRHGALAPLKTWFKWLARENHILYNPASELDLPKLPKHLLRAILSVREVETILAETDPATPYGLRDRAMLELLYSTGIRRMEVAGLALYDVDATRRLVFVREGKGAKDRVVPIGERALAWLDRYPRVRGRGSMNPLPRHWYPGPVRLSGNNVCSHLQ